MDNLFAIIHSYLDNEDGSADILNDFLEEHGRPRCAPNVDVGGRFVVVLDELLPRPEAELLACEFAERVVSVIEADGKDPAPMIDIVTAKRACLEGRCSEAELYEIARSSLVKLWDSNKPNVTRAAWSAWAAAMAKPSNAAASARAASDGELEWQMQRTRDVLQKLSTL